MPIYDVTDENTGITLTLEGDRPPTQQQLDAIFTQERTRQRAQLVEQQRGELAESRRLGRQITPGQTEAAIRGFAQGATLGLGEEIGAGVSALGALGDDDETVSERYRRLRDEQRAQQRLARQAHPITTAVGEAAGGLAGGIAGAGRAVAGQTLRQAIPRLAGIGGAEGAVAGYGFTEAEDPTAQAADVATGAAIGGALGVAVPAVGAGLSRAARRVVAPFTAERRVARQIEADLRADDLTVAQAEARLAENPNLILADLGENMQQRLGAIANQPGPAAQRARDILETRNINQLDRLRPQFEEALGSQGVLEASRQATRRAQQASQPLYEEAYASELRGTARLQELMGRDAAQAALRRAHRKAINEGVDITQPGSNVRIMDYVQRALNDRQRASLATAPDDARIIRNLRNDILAEVDRQVPAFRDARRIWAGEFANQDALDFGGRVFREPTPQLREAYNEMSAAEQDHFRIGVFDAIIDRLGTKVETANLIQDFRKPKIREAMEIAFDNPQLFREFERTIGDERLMFETMRKALQGSPTASRLAFMEQPSIAGQVAGDVMLGPGAGAVAQQAGRGVMQRVGEAFAAPGAARRSELASEALLGRSPEQTLQQLVTPPRLPAQVGPVTGGAALPLIEQLVPRGG